MSQWQYTQQYVTETDFTYQDNMIIQRAYSSNWWHHQLPVLQEYNSHIKLHMYTCITHSASRKRTTICNQI